LSALDLRSLLELLHQREIRFVVIGGVAVAAHGYVRGTADLDLVPDPDPENLERLAEITADTSLGGLDVVQRARGVPSYSQLDGDAIETELLGVPVRICSLTRLREMKEAQGRPEDKVDLANLPEDDN
jgi:hypothetical protein